jgi:flagellar biosynthetic protein FliO
MALQVIGSLILILGGLLLTLRLLKKYVPSIAGARDLSVSEQLHLGDRCRIMVVRVRGEELLLGVTREHISILDKLPPSAEPVAAQSIDPQSFTSWLGGLKR